MAPASDANRDDAEIARLRTGRHTSPHDWLGAHSSTQNGVDGILVRALHPDAAGCDLLLPGDDETPASERSMTVDAGLFTGFVPGATLPLRYRLRFHFAGGACWERDDPYRFLPTLGELDLHLFNEGTHRRLWEVLGASVRELDGVRGVAFAVWAPGAAGVSVVGDFCCWDGRLFPMRSLGSSGVFELFVPEIGDGALYKFEIRTPAGALRLKSDPFARSMELPPGSASRVVDRSRFAWHDESFLAARRANDPARRPLAIYEVHLSSFARVPEERNRRLGYRELAPRLAAHAKRLGFTHVELLPVAEHPFDGSWGYQVTGYYAPTSRFGTPDDLRALIDHLHGEGIGVILDWVPAHFPKDDFALRRFDGTALYEHEDPRRGEHPDWGTLIFNYGRHEVRNFLVANALYWLEEFHVDGLRVDAVASMLYLDYSRAEGEWLPNAWGGRENVDAIEFLRQLNHVIATEHPGCITIAEESTAWRGVTAPVSQGGLGFGFKWNMGWMHDTLGYFSRDPVHRGFHHDDLTFAMLYEYSERFVMPLSHDEVVHGKRSLRARMPGDDWQQRANLRTLFAYQWLRPGKKLLFMGSEFAPFDEWNADRSLDWHLLDDPRHAGVMRCLEALGRLYHESPCLWRNDHDPAGFRWIDCSDRAQSVIAFERRDGDAVLLVVLNLTPVPREDYRVGASLPGRWIERFSTDASEFGGSDFPRAREIDAEANPWHGQPWSLRLRLPPLSALVLGPGGR